MDSQNSPISYADLYNRFNYLIENIIKKSSKDTKSTEVSTVATVIFNQELIRTALGIDYHYHQGQQIASKVKPLISSLLDNLTPEQTAQFNTLLVTNLETSLKHFLEDLAPTLAESQKEEILSFLKGQLGSK